MKYLYITTAPVLLLGLLFFSTKKSTIEGKFKRSYNYNVHLIPIDTIAFNNYDNIDGIAVDNGNLWINKRNHILKYNKSPEKQYKIFPKDNSLNKPIINFYVDGNIVYYYQGNTREIKKVNTGNRNLDKTFSFNFPITYFSKLRSNAFIFQESIIGTAGIRIHYIDFDNKKEFTNEKIFPDGYGYGMKFSGNWMSVKDNNSAIFCAFHSDFLLKFDSTGNLLYKTKPIDYQNQKLDLIKENNLYYLSPHVNTLRINAFATINRILILSNVIGKDDSYEDFKSKSSVDVYDSSDGAYKYSFYIPNFMQEKALSFVTTNNGLVYAVYNKNIVIYKNKEIINL